MKKFLLYSISTFLLTVNIQSQNIVTVTILVKANNLPAGSSVYIAGNDVKFGNWQPDAIKLSEIQSRKWVKRFSFTKGQKLEFKITRGSWDTEALNDDGSITSNHIVEVLNDTTIEIKVKLWADMVEQKTEGQITGIVKYHLDMRGKDISPRDVIVWLPPFYFLEPEKRYPVLYMHDGQNIFDPRTSAFKVDWQIDEAADSLIRQGIIEDIIIVGIYNTPDRSSEYSENDTGYAYMNFIVDSLKPFIDKNYRTKPERDFTADGGASLGGLISFILIWDYSEVFSTAICFSPAFKIDKYNFVDNVNSYIGKRKEIQVYINNGNNELDSTLQVGIDEMLLALKNQGYLEGKDFIFNKDPKGLHGERDWARNIWRALIFICGTEKGRSLL